MDKFLFSRLTFLQVGIDQIKAYLLQGTQDLAHGLLDCDC